MKMTGMALKAILLTVSLFWGAPGTLPAADARNTPQLTSREAIDVAFVEAAKWDSEAVLWHVAPPGRMLDYHWADNDLSWEWTILFARPKDNKSYRVTIVNGNIAESLEETHVSRKEPIPGNAPARGAIVSMKDAAESALLGGAPLSGRPMAAYSTSAQWAGGSLPQWEFLFGSVYRMYRVNALTGDLLEVVQFEPKTLERLDHLLDTTELELALEKSGELFIYRFFEAIDEGDQDEALAMTAPSVSGNDQMREMWRASFASLDLVRVVKVIREPEKKWHDGNPVFEVELFTRPDPGKGFSGWEEGFDTRWVTLIREGENWKVAEITTSP